MLVGRLVSFYSLAGIQFLLCLVVCSQFCRHALQAQDNPRLSRARAR